MDLYRQALRPLLFRREAEAAHATALAGIGAVGRWGGGRAVLGRLGGGAGPRDPRLAQQLAGLDLDDPVGLAAGLDKNGHAVQALAALGFAAIEVGSVSAHASAGNPRPRLFRLPADEAIVVNYGVPNDGADVIARRLAGAPVPVPLGVNLVETNTGRPPDADTVVDELAAAARRFVGIADYLTLNLNCPNTTAGVSPFDDPRRLAALLEACAAIDGLPPLFLKFTAHADAARMESFLEAVDPFAFVVGFIFNLPPGKAYATRTPAAALDPLPGTLCGPPTRSMMDDVLRAWYVRIDRTRHILVGSGGIAGPDDAWRKICLGASWLQLYTAFVYQGPALLGRIRRGLGMRLEQTGLAHISQATGLAHAVS